MNTSPRNCLVAGSTGLIGNLLTKELVNSNDQVTALSRYELSSTDELLTFRKIDFENEESFKDLFLDISDAFICLGTTIKKAESRKLGRIRQLDRNTADEASERKKQEDLR